MSRTKPVTRSAVHSNVAPTANALSDRATGAANVAAVMAILLTDEVLLESDLAKPIAASISPSSPVPGQRALPDTLQSGTHLSPRTRARSPGAW